MTRRELLGWAAATAALLPDLTRAAPDAKPTKPTKPAPTAKPSEPRAADSTMTLNTRTIPKSGEQLPVVGLGTWQTFDVGSTTDERTAVREVLTKFLAAGMKVIDSSPMYGRAEEVTGDELAKVLPANAPFLATKVSLGRLPDAKQRDKMAEAFVRT